MRIAMFCNDYWPTVGGVQTGARGMAAALLRRGHEVTILTRQPGGCPPLEVVDGVTVRRYEWNLRPRLTFPLRLWRMRQAVRADLRAWGATVMYAHFVSAHALYAWDCARMARVPLVLSFRGNDVMRIAPRSVASRRIYGLLTRAAAANLFCSKWLARQGTAARWFRGRPDRIGVLADAVITEPRRLPSTLPTGAFVLAAGRFVHKKGFDLLLRAWAVLQDTVPPLWLVGDGEERDALQQLAAELGLGTRVHFAGALSHPELLGLLERAALCVVPSREEPYGIMPVEAQALGIPLVATNVGNLPELIEPERTGWLAPPTVEGLATTIAAAWRDPRRAEIGAAGRRAPGATRTYPTMACELEQWITRAQQDGATWT
ncbi:MAG TPA: glycosyltransferase family 4 protein [Gemmatimonadales bacterium]|nr:glycosyltransferase family 4 protein [Gemmatimonadales bacterium]